MVSASYSLAFSEHIANPDYAQGHEENAGPTPATLKSLIATFLLMENLA